MQYEEKEMIDIVDINGNPTGRTFMRGEVLQPGEFFRASMVCIFNREGKLLIQKRKKDKKNWPGLWDVSAGGAIIAGETPQEAAQREVREELGIDLDLLQSRPKLVTTFTTGFTYTFVVTADFRLEDLTLQKEEVEEAAFADLEQICRMMEDGSFIRYRKPWLDYIFEVSDGNYIF